MDLSKLTKEQLLVEIEKLDFLIMKVTVSPRQVDLFDELSWIAGTVVIGASIIFGGPLGLVGLLSGAAGLGLIGASILRETGMIKGDMEIAALIDALRVKRAEVYREYNSRR